VTESVRGIAELVAAGELVVLSGAGISTESGIPDYRGASGAARRGQPMTYQVFTGDPVARRRYWARSHLGWRSITHAAPNAGHRAVAELQRRGLLAGIITQNVDGLHQAAGAGDVVELHGNLARVVCLGCKAPTTRSRLHDRLLMANPGFDTHAAEMAPDGDADLDDRLLAGFTVVDCEHCGGMLKPDVVFFGESVDPDRVRHCYALVERARAVLVLGSSLTVHSGRRFVTHAAKLGRPVGIINQGPTRADDRAVCVLDAPLGAALVRILDELRVPA
jgi:NAD-dependent SIR2 family protein deacetylase